MGNDKTVDQVTEAMVAGHLSAESGENIKKTFVGGKEGSLEQVSLGALVGAGEWGELSDRFFRRLAFGTGGLRGRTIGQVVTEAERGRVAELGRPEFPAVGTN